MWKWTFCSYLKWWCNGITCGKFSATGDVFKCIDVYAVFGT